LREGKGLKQPEYVEPTKLMANQASRIEMTMKPVTVRELESLGGTVDASGVWTFRDGSRGRVSKRPVAVYDDDHKPVGFTYFDRLDRLQ
jgi:hypothetical protein